MRIPNSLPFVFSALKVASVLAMIGAVVGDYFGGSTEALGVVDPEPVRALAIRDRVGCDSRSEHLGIAFYAAIAGVERYALSWHPSVARRAI